MLGRGAHGGLLGASVGTDLQKGSYGIAHGFWKETPAAEAQQWALWWARLWFSEMCLHHLGATLVTWMQNKRFVDSFVKHEQKSPAWYNSGSGW